MFRDLVPDADPCLCGSVSPVHGSNAQGQKPEAPSCLRLVVNFGGFLKNI